MSWNMPDPSANKPELPKAVISPNTSLADKIKARAENVAVQIQEIFPLKELQKILEEA
jgi:hypothetical protein